MSEHEKSGVPGSMAHSARLRQILDEKDSKLSADAGELTTEQKNLLTRVRHETLVEPSLSLAEVLEMFESLLSDPDLGPEAVYRCIDDLRAKAEYTIYTRAFRAGLEASSDPSDV